MKALKKIIISNRQSILLLIFILLIFIIKFNFFMNTYVVLKNNIHQRLENDYGYCYPMGYGFVKDSLKKFNLKGENIIYVNNNNYPSSQIFTFSFKSNEANKIFFLNHKIEEVKKKIKNFKILYSSSNCHLIELE